MFKDVFQFISSQLLLKHLQPKMADSGLYHCGNSYHVEHQIVLFNSLIAVFISHLSSVKIWHRSKNKAVSGNILSVGERNIGNFLKADH